MSQIKNLADAIRATGSQAPHLIRSTQQAGQALKKAQLLAASTSYGRAVAGQIESLLSEVKGILNSLETFNQGAHQFADSLAYGQGSNTASASSAHSGVPTLSTTHVGNHMAIKESDGGGNSVVTRFDPETGNILAWNVDQNGRTLAATATLKGISSEYRTSQERQVATQIGKATRDTHNEANGVQIDNGGHLLAAIFAGSNGAINIVPQNAQLNQKTYWNEFERHILDLLNEGYEIDVSVHVNYPDKNGIRPDTFSVNFLATHPTKGPKMRSRIFENTEGGGQSYG